MSNPKITPSSLPISYTVFSNSLLCIVPDGVNCEQLKAALGWSEKDAKKLWPKAAFIISDMLERQTHRRDEQGTLGPIPINARINQETIGYTHSTRLLKELQEAGILVCASEACAGFHYSRRFHLGPDYQDRPLKFVHVASAMLSRKLSKDRAQENRKALWASPTRRLIFENMKTVSLPLTLEQLAGQQFEDRISQVCWLRSVRDIVLGNRRVWADEKTGRLFHNFTNCPRNLRRLLRVSGEPSAQVDIANAQPYFLQSILPAGNTLASDGLSCIDVNEFKESVCDGRFYEALLWAMPERERIKYVGRGCTRGLPFEGDARARFKQETFRTVLYARLPKDAEDVLPIFGALCRTFPTVGRVLKKRRRTKAGATALAREMQKAEADLMLGRVFPRIFAELPECKPVSIHDAILCQDRFKNDVARIIQEEAVKVYGVAPRITVKD